MINIKIIDHRICNVEVGDNDNVEEDNDDDVNVEEGDDDDGKSPPHRQAAQVGSGCESS